MKYKKPELYKIFPYNFASAICMSGDDASLGFGCQAGPDAGTGCASGAAAGSKCMNGAAAGTGCNAGVAFD